MIGLGAVVPFTPPNSLLHPYLFTLFPTYLDLLHDYSYTQVYARTWYCLTIYIGGSRQNKPRPRLQADPHAPIFRLNFFTFILYLHPTSLLRETEAAAQGRRKFLVPV